MALQISGVTEVIDMSPKTGPYEVQLTNGGKVMVHDEVGYTNVYKDGQSLDHLIDPECKEIKFSFNFKLHKDGINELKALGNEICSHPMCCYHMHVWWNYAFKLRVVKKEEDGVPHCAMEIVSIGPKLTTERHVKKGGVGDNFPPNQTAPKVQYIQMVFTNADGREEKVPLIPNNNGFVSAPGWTITVTRLQEALDEKKKSTVDMECGIQIARDYFDIGKQMKESKITPLETPAALASILRGERTPLCDFVITCGQGEKRDYHVHKKVLADVSTQMQIIFQTHQSLPSDQILVVSHEDRMIMPKMDEKDMELLLTFFYSRRILLPQFDRYSRVGRALSALFTRDTLSSFFEEWERAIVGEVTKLDRTSSYSSAVVCLKHLISIFSTPYGAMPLAKRVCISTLADILQMCDTLGTRDALDTQLNETEELKTEMLQSITLCTYKLGMLAGAVEKGAVN